MFATLMYHIVDDEIADPIAVSRQAFAEQMDFLKTEGYHTLSLDEACALARGERPAVPRSVLITFDDGYHDNVEHALPVLVRSGLTATLFVISAHIGQSNRWNPKACYDTRHLGWDGLRAWLAAGNEIGGHSHEHLCMVRLHETELRAAVRVNKEILEAGLDRALIGFSYPYGRFDERVRRVVAEHYQIAFSDSTGTWWPAADRYAINRIAVRPEWRLGEFAAHVERATALAFRKAAVRD
jgi:peptidoglycan/xylan/chitin deacetylase (PgdA/CDA1 family)